MKMTTKKDAHTMTKREEAALGSASVLEWDFQRIEAALESIEGHDTAVTAIRHALTSARGEVEKMLCREIVGLEDSAGLCKAIADEVAEDRASIK